MRKIITSISIVMVSLVGFIYLASQCDSLNHVQVNWSIATFEANIAFVIFDIIWFVLCYITMHYCKVRAERKNIFFAVCNFADILPYSFFWGYQSYMKDISILWLSTSYLIILLPKAWEFLRLYKSTINEKDIIKNLVPFCLFSFTIYLMGCLLVYYLHDNLIGIFHLNFLANILNDSDIFLSIAFGAILGIWFIIRYRKIVSLSSTQGYYYLLRIFNTFYSIFLVFGIIINTISFSLERLFFYQLPYTILSSIMMVGINMIINYKKSPMVITNRCKHLLSSKRTVRNIFYLSIYCTIFYTLLSLFDYWFAKRANYLAYIFNLHFLPNRLNMTFGELKIYILVLIAIVFCISLLLQISCIRKFKKSYRAGFIHTGYTFLGIYFILSNSIHWISKFDFGIYCSWFGGHVYEGEILSNYILSLILCTYFVVLLHQLNCNK